MKTSHVLWGTLIQLSKRKKRVYLPFQVQPLKIFCRLSFVIKCFRILIYIQFDFAIDNHSNRWRYGCLFCHEDFTHSKDWNPSETYAGMKIGNAIALSGSENIGAYTEKYLPNLINDIIISGPCSSYIRGFTENTII